MAMLDDHVNNSKRHRMDIMDEYLASIGYQRKLISKDGSCLFRAVSEQLFSSQINHLRVRESCVKYMKHHQELFEHFVDVPYDDYLSRMSNPKECADQIEISALSKLYMCDFYIYELPGKIAKNVTDNDYEKKVYLCHSGQKHYDSVYPIEYFKTYGICQSILYSVLFEQVLGNSAKEQEKLVSTLRLLSSSSSDEEEETRAEEYFPPDRIYQPSIGNFEKGVVAKKQMGLAYKLPVSLDFARSLDPSIFRNIDYDFWITIKRRRQYIDFSVVEGMHYNIGDKCLISLNIYSKPLVGHVQEVSPNWGPVTVFIEALADVYTVAVKNVKSLDKNSSRWYGEASLWRDQTSWSDGGWYFRNGGNRKHGAKGRKHGSSGSFRGKFNFNPKHHLQFVASQQKKLRNNWPLSDGTNRNETNNHAGTKAENRKNNKLEVFSPHRSKRFHKNRASEQQWAGCDLSPSEMLQNLSINPNSYTEETGSFSNDGGTSANPPNPQNCQNNGEWCKEQASPDHQYQQNYSNSQDMGYNPQNDDLYPASYPQCWSNDPYESTRVKAASGNNAPSQNHQSGSSTNEYSLESLSSTKSNGTSHFVEKFTSPPPYSPEKCQALGSSTPMTPDYPAIPIIPEQGYPMSSNEVTDNGENYALPLYAPPHDIRPIPPLAPPSMIGYLPHPGTVTVYDAEGKEFALVDDRYPVQYFYNLGVEYCRPINSGPRPIPVALGPPPPVPYLHHSPVLPSQPVGYIPAVPNTNYVPPQITTHAPPNVNCVPIAHFHPAMLPPGAVQSSLPQGRFIVHVPPPAPQQPQCPQPPPLLQDAPANTDSHNMHDNLLPIATSTCNHMVMMTHDNTPDVASSSFQAGHVTNSPTGGAYPGFPIHNSNNTAFVQRMYPHPIPPYHPIGVGASESGQPFRHPLHHAYQPGPPQHM